MSRPTRWKMLAAVVMGLGAPAYAGDEAMTSVSPGRILSEEHLRGGMQIVALNRKAAFRPLQLQKVRTGSALQARQTLRASKRHESRAPRARFIGGRIN